MLVSCEPLSSYLIQQVLLSFNEATKIFDNCSLRLSVERAGFQH